MFGQQVYFTQLTKLLSGSMAGSGVVGEGDFGSMVTVDFPGDEIGDVEGVGADIGLRMLGDGSIIVGKADGTVGDICADIR